MLRMGRLLAQVILLKAIAELFLPFLAVLLHLLVLTCQLGAEAAELQCLKLHHVRFRDGGREKKRTWLFGSGRISWCLSLSLNQQCRWRWQQFLLGARQRKVGGAELAGGEIRGLTG